MSLAGEHRARLKQKFESTPFYKLLGMKLIHLEDGKASVSISPKQELTQYLNTLHGAAITAAADSAVAFALLSKVKPGKTVTTVELKINFLKAVTQSNITANANVIHVGRRIALGDVEVVDSNKSLVAKCLATYMILKSSKNEK